MKDCRNVHELLKEGKAILKEAGIPEFSLDCQLFMMEATGLSKVELYTHSEYILVAEEQNRFFELVHQRKEKKPTQYILGKNEFMGMEFKVNSQVLIPRADTEILVETVWSYAKKEKIHTIIDIGTGSGCIGISLKKLGIPEVWAVDISEKALCIAQENAKSNEAEVCFLQSDLFAQVPKKNQFDAIVSNPPYIATKEIEALMEEVKCYEPLLALDGGTEGLDFYERILIEGMDCLKESGWIFFEIGYNQGKAVSKLFLQHGFVDIQVIQDLSGMDRIVLGKKGVQV